MEIAKASLDRFLSKYLILEGRGLLEEHNKPPCLCLFMVTKAILDLNVTYSVNQENYLLNSLQHSR